MKFPSSQQRFNFYFEIYNYLKPHHDFKDTVYIKLMISVDIQLVNSRWDWRVPSSRRQSRWPGSDDGSRDGEWTRRRQCCRAGEWEPSCPSCRGTDDAASSPWLRTFACSLLGATCDTPPTLTNVYRGTEGAGEQWGIDNFPWNWMPYIHRHGSLTLGGYHTFDKLKIGNQRLEVAAIDSEI